MIHSFLSRAVNRGRVVRFDVNQPLGTIEIELLYDRAQKRLVLVCRDVIAFGAMMSRVDLSRPRMMLSPSSPCMPPYSNSAIFNTLMEMCDESIVELPITSTAFVQHQIDDPRWIPWWPLKRTICEEDKLVHLAFHDVELEDQEFGLEVMVCVETLELYVNGRLSSAEKLYKQQKQLASPRNDTMYPPPPRTSKLQLTDCVGMPAGLLDHVHPHKAWITFEGWAWYHVHEIHSWFIDAKRAYINVRAEQFYPASQFISLVDMQMTFWELDQWVLHECCFTDV